MDYTVLITKAHLDSVSVSPDTSYLVLIIRLGQRYYGSSPVGGNLKMLQTKCFIKTSQHAGVFYLFAVQWTVVDSLHECKNSSSRHMCVNQQQLIMKYAPSSPHALQIHVCVYQIQYPYTLLAVHGYTCITLDECEIKIVLTDILHSQYIILQSSDHSLDRALKHVYSNLKLSFIRTHLWHLCLFQRTHVSAMLSVFSSEWIYVFVVLMAIVYETGNGIVDISTK